MQHITSVSRAIEHVGGIGRLAHLMGIKPPSVHEWKTGKRPVPAKRCMQIERITGGTVTRRDLRPDDYGEIWPELMADQSAAGG